MKIFIDAQYRCHVSNETGDLREVETDVFNGACNEFIEGHRFVPYGEAWINEKGVRFFGEMVTPWKPYDELEAVQRNYELTLLADMKTALNLLGVTVDE